MSFDLSHTTTPTNITTTMTTTTTAATYSASTFSLLLIIWSMLHQSIFIHKRFTKFEFQGMADKFTA